ncbi:hypothetical protein SCATT_40510 [Streptantibioticus cattleyicolor NRRL 8057 = DSM 46488]|uniref:Uncharacterized protein n=1 Tax=Streptantibioticus cattleyicolor (strain ATCC 35852 / DSM 46488 / JCM 4925 / NBRC 14057 / NRRL 8057) TaxID=1003195 RepID=G8WXB2_STREN|nr:hypothetical protein SCATT_40510 [Streptantibioticus cattleyicolor NRRL 8057 = DSM 46488]
MAGWGRSPLVEGWWPGKWLAGWGRSPLVEGWGCISSRPAGAPPHRQPPPSPTRRPSSPGRGKRFLPVGACHLRNSRPGLSVGPAGG